MVGGTRERQEVSVLGLRKIKDWVCYYHLGSFFSDELSSFSLFTNDNSAYKQHHNINYSERRLQSLCVFLIFISLRLCLLIQAITLHLRFGVKLFERLNKVDFKSTWNKLSSFFLQALVEFFMCHSAIMNVNSRGSF